MKRNLSFRILILALLAMITLNSFAEDEAAGAKDESEDTYIPVPPRRPKIIDDEKDDSQTGARFLTSKKKGCIECEARKNALRQVTTAVKKRKKVTPFKKGGRGKPLAKMCTAIIDGAQQEGPTGFLLEQDAKKKYPNEFGDKKSLAPICPGYKDMSATNRKKAWAWFFMVLANEESNCNPNQVHGTRFPDGRVLNPHAGWGLWTMEQSSTLRKARGPECEGNIKTIAVQVKCTLYIMSRQLERFESVLVPAPQDQTYEYWGPLKSERYRKQITPNMMKFPGCAPKRKKK